MPSAPVERREIFRLLGLAHGIVLLSRDCGMEMEVEAKNNVLDGGDCDSLGCGGSVLAMRTPRQEEVSASTGPVMGKEKILTMMLMMMRRSAHP